MFSPTALSPPPNAVEIKNMAEIKAWPEQNIVSIYLQRRKTGFHKPPKRVLSSKAALEELFVLLEDYAPVWYTQEHHDRALAAILQKEP